MSDENENEESLGERPLAYLAVVSDVNDIPGRDRIVLAMVNGFQTCMTKGVEAGDFVVYHEVDSMVPVSNPLYKFLEKDAKPETGRARIKTRKMGGAYSRGLAIPWMEVVDASPELHEQARQWGAFSSTEARALAEGFDCTKILNITKHLVLPSQKGSANPRGSSWPSEAPSKTDEDLVQNHMYLLRDTMPHPIYVTQKLDGQSATYYRLHDDTLVTCSRKQKIAPYVEGDLDNWNSIAISLDLKNRIPPGYCIQGEIVGPDIQANRMGLDRKKFFVFNVFKLSGAEDFLASPWEPFGYPEAVSLVSSWGLEFVPVITGGPTLKEMFHTEDEKAIVLGLEKLSTTQRYSNGFPAEGIVVRPMKPTKTMWRGVPNGKTLSFKVINPEFELKTQK